MKTPNPNAALINKIEELITEAAAVTPVDPHQAMIVAGLHTARDFALQHGQAQQSADAQVTADAPATEGLNPNS